MPRPGESWIWGRRPRGSTSPTCPVSPSPRRSSPLDFRGVWFVSPSIDYAVASTDVFDGDEKFAEYRTSILSGALAIGAQLGKYGEAKVGLTRGRARARPSIGAPDLPRFNIPIAAYAGRLVTDRLDNPS